MDDTKELTTTMMMVNMENNSSYSHHHLYDHHNHQQQTTAADDDVDQTTSLGFMELLDYQDYDSYPSSIFDSLMTYQQLPPPPLSMEMIISTSAHHLNNRDDNNVDLDYKLKEEFTNINEVEEESSVVLNGQPSSPNCSSIISSPDHQRLNKQQPEDQQCSIKEKNTMDGDETKTTKKKKKDREPRFAFMTRTEIDHLDDGYRWRKYGQKAVKNSHFPRSYYRCTSTSCNVKKRVERCMGDSSYVITTYEGKHNHPVARNSTPLIPSFNHLITTTAASASFATAPPAMLKLEQGGLLQDMLHCHY